MLHNVAFKQALVSRRHGIFHNRCPVLSGKGHGVGIEKCHFRAGQPLLWELGICVSFQIGKALRIHPLPGVQHGIPGKHIGFRHVPQLVVQLGKGIRANYHGDIGIAIVPCLQAFFVRHGFAPGTGNAAHQAYMEGSGIGNPHHPLIEVFRELGQPIFHGFQRRINGIRMVLGFKAVALQQRFRRFQAHRDAVFFADLPGIGSACFQA